MEKQLIILSAAFFALMPLQAESKKPNIIFIMADDLGYNHLSIHGQKRLKTPHIDNLFRQSMSFTNAYAGSTVCGPSRSSLMTGLHSGKIPYKTNPSFTDLDPSNPTIGELLKKAGYTNGYFGKWGLTGRGSGLEPNDLGYDEFLGMLSHGHGHRHYPKYLNHNRKSIELNVTPPNGNTSSNPEDRKKHTHDAFTEAALDFISKEAKKPNKPFFCFLSFTIPHTEIIATDKAAGEFLALNWKEDYVANTSTHIKQAKPRSHFAGMLRMMDDSVGEIVKKIDELGIREDTVIIFTSDNGGQLKQVWGKAPSVWFEANGKLRGGKQDMYEGGIKVQFAVSWKGKIEPNKTSPHFTYFADVLPTFCELAKIDVPEGISGLSVLPSLIGSPKAQEKHEVMCWAYNKTKAIRKGRWKAIQKGNGKVLLFDIDTDPCEKKNVVAQNPEVVEDMKKLFASEFTADSKKPRSSAKCKVYPYDRE